MRGKTDFAAKARPDFVTTGFAGIFCAPEWRKETA
jgi:hypothetical protein